MNEFREKGVGRLGSKGLLVSMIVVTILVVSSTVAVVAMSRSSADTTLTITSVSHDPEEGYVDQLVEWTVVVETQEGGQQGRGLLFTWSWGDGSYTVDYLKSIGSNTTAINTQTHAWSESGRYKVAISVWDGFDTEQSALHNVTARVWFVVTSAPPNEPPVASFAVVSINGATVSVDASTSYDPDGTIVSYNWDWGDGSVGTGETATHTYELPETTTLSSTGTTSDIPPLPYSVLGFTRDVYGVPMPNSTVTVTNVRTAEFLVASSDVDGFYICDIASMPVPFEDGDMILVEAVNDGYSGSSVGYVNVSVLYIQVDVTLEWDPSQGSFEVEITLTVVDDGNLTGTAVRSVMINFTSTTPPVAAFTVSVDGLTVSVNASESWDNEDPVEELEVRWDWENDGVWDTEWTTDKMATHVYAVAGTYDVILEVMDREGLTDTANRSVTVFESPGPAEHEPIRIDGDEEFTYENGVVQGTGSVLNPFVIEEWTIEADTASGISIANTEAHFVIRDVNVFNGLNNGFNSGISLCNVTNGTVDSCMASYCGWGIAVFSCFNINISNNDITSCYYGVGVVDTSAVYVWLNHVSSSLGIGISVNFTTTDFILFRNTIVDSGFYGVDMAGCQLGWVDSNTIAGSGTCGVRLTGHNEQITVVHNAFLNNTVQAEDDNFVENAWNSGYPLGGNYWSDYDGVDLFSGPDQDLPGSDGIGDTPYTIGVFDQYPLMTPP